MITNNLNIPYSKISSFSELSPIYQDLIEKAKLAMVNAYAPYSNFYVGASVLFSIPDTDPQIVSGNNQENGAYPSGLCAERVALFSAVSQFPNLTIKALALCGGKNKILSPKPLTPCGACRQVLLEYALKQNPPIKVILIGQNESILIPDSKSLLPFAFTLD